MYTHHVTENTKHVTHVYILCNTMLHTYTISYHIKSHGIHKITVRNTMQAIDSIHVINYVTHHVTAK